MTGKIFSSTRKDESAFAALEVDDEYLPLVQSALVFNGEICIAIRAIGQARSELMTTCGYGKSAIDSCCAVFVKPLRR